jgi:hypothetical protein
VFYLFLIVQYNLLKAVKLLNTFIKIKPSLSIPLSGVKQETCCERESSNQLELGCCWGMSGMVKHFDKHLARNIRKAQPIGLKSRSYHNIGNPYHKKCTH